MAIIPQQKLFGWEEIDDLGDLERLQLVLDYIPDEGLMRHLEKECGGGRDDYQVRAVWNSILAGVVFEVTRASRSEVPEAHRFLERLDERHPELLDECESFLADKGLEGRQAD